MRPVTYECVAAAGTETYANTVPLKKPMRVQILDDGVAHTLHNVNSTTMNAVFFRYALTDVVNDPEDICGR